MKALCTTDDPTDDLACHRAVAAEGLATKVFPALRPDKALNVHRPPKSSTRGWRASKPPPIRPLAHCRNFWTPCAAVTTSSTRMGGRLSDHGLNHAYADFCSDEEASRIFGRARAGHPAEPDEHRRSHPT